MLRNQKNTVIITQKNLFDLASQYFLELLFIKNRTSNQHCELDKTLQDTQKRTELAKR